MSLVNSEKRCMISWRSTAACNGSRCSKAAIRVKIVPYFTNAGKYRIRIMGGGSTGYGMGFDDECKGYGKGFDDESSRLKECITKERQARQKPLEAIWE